MKTNTTSEATSNAKANANTKADTNTNAKVSTKSDAKAIGTENAPRAAAAKRKAKTSNAKGKAVDTTGAQFPSVLQWESSDEDGPPPPPVKGSKKKVSAPAC